MSKVKIIGKQKYMILHANGEHSIVVTEAEMPLEQMQKIVGGYIEGPYVITFRMNGSFVRQKAFVNEDGISLDLPQNKWVSSIRGDILCIRVEGSKSLGTVQ